MLSVINNPFILSVVMLNVIMLRVVVPLHALHVVDDLTRV